MGIGSEKEQTVLPSDTEIRVPAAETFTADIVHFSGDMKLRVVLMGEGASCHIRCVYLSSGADKNHIGIEVVHQSPNTSSVQEIRGILTDESTMDFAGVIRIPPDVQKCDGAQNHRAFLLSDNALVRATPELEIFADDVKCAHGSAIGPLDKTQLFYFLSRGIDQKTAEKMLLKGLIADLIPTDFTPYIEEWMTQHV